MIIPLPIIALELNTIRLARFLQILGQQLVNIPAEEVIFGPLIHEELISRRFQTSVEELAGIVLVCLGSFVQVSSEGFLAPRTVLRVHNRSESGDGFVAGESEFTATFSNQIEIR
jgi:hypothetical protein